MHRLYVSGAAVPGFVAIAMLLSAALSKPHVLSTAASFLLHDSSQASSMSPARDWSCDLPASVLQALAAYFLSSNRALDLSQRRPRQHILELFRGTRLLQRARLPSGLHAGARKSPEGPV